MSVKEFCSKFFDHGTKQVLILKFLLFSKEEAVWNQKLNDEQKFIDWNNKYGPWIAAIKTKITGMMREKYFPKLSEEFGDYRLIEEFVDCKCKMINRNLDNNKIIDFKEVKSIEKFIRKFERGTKPANWTNMFDYNKKKIIHTYMLTGSPMKENFNLEFVSTTVIPPENADLARNANAVANVNTNANVNAVANVNASTLNNESGRNSNASVNLSTESSPLRTDVENIARNTGKSVADVVNDTRNIINKSIAAIKGRPESAQAGGAKRQNSKTSDSSKTYSDIKRKVGMY